MGTIARQVSACGPFCLRANDNAAVVEAAQILDSLGIAKAGPRLWPEYAPDYYAVFFSDPDGIRLEVMNFRSGRKQIREQWDRLVEFENPFDKLSKLQSK